MPISVGTTLGFKWSFGEVTVMGTINQVIAVPLKKKNVFTIEEVTRENPLNLGRFGISPEASSLAHRL